MDDLKELNRENFKYREWVALTWARHYLVYEGAFPDPEVVSEFTRLYSSREQTDIMAAVKMMFFFNMLSNTIFDKPLNDTFDGVNEANSAKNQKD